MNRGLIFYNPNKREWAEYNRRVLGDPTFGQSSTSPEEELQPQRRVYLLASYMPAITLRLTQPDLTWCMDMSTSGKNETKNEIGSAYFVMDGCVLGPWIQYSDAASDEKVKGYIRIFAMDASNSVRWLLHTYHTTNILPQFDMLGVDVAVAKNIRNKLAYESYTPLRLITELPTNTTTDGTTVPTKNNDRTNSRAPQQQHYFDYGGAIGQIGRPHLGAAPIITCQNPRDSLVFNDTYAIRADDETRLNSMIAINRENMPPIIGFTSYNGGGGGGGGSTFIPTTGEPNTQPTTGANDSQPSSQPNGIATSTNFDGSQPHNNSVLPTFQDGVNQQQPSSTFRTGYESMARNIGIGDIENDVDMPPADATMNSLLNTTDVDAFLANMDPALGR